MKAAREYLGALDDIDVAKEMLHDAADADEKEMLHLNKEYAHQTDLVKAAREYLGALDDIDVAKEMLHDAADADEKEMLQMAISENEAKLPQLEEDAREYLGALDDIDVAKEMLHDAADADEKEMLQMAISENEAKLPQLEEDIKIMLIPGDPMDEKDTLVEIRSAAGGDEAAIFAGDLFKMYQRFIESKKWKMTVLDSSPSEAGGEKDTIVEIRSAAGGDEAAIFAGDLFKMYQRFIESKKWKMTVLDSSPSEAGGFKSIEFKVEGDKVYSVMKYESGVHRVQRVPKTESQGRIKTSTATVAVLPERVPGPHQDVHRDGGRAARGR